MAIDDKLEPILLVARAPDWMTALMKLVGRADFPDQWRKHAIWATRDWAGAGPPCERRAVVDALLRDLAVTEDEWARFFGALILLGWSGEKETAAFLARLLEEAAKRSGIHDSNGSVRRAVRGWKLFGTGDCPAADCDPIAAAQKVGAGYIAELDEKNTVNGLVAELICYEPFPHDKFSGGVPDLSPDIEKLRARLVRDFPAAREIIDVIISDLVVGER